IRRIEARQQTARLLEPRRVRLEYKDTPLAEALADFTRQSGVPFVLQGGPTLAANRKITLATGMTSFWEAFDQFCRQAQLVEQGDRREEIHLAPAASLPARPTSYAGKVRLRLLPGEAGAGDAKHLQLEVSPEAGLPCQTVSRIRIDVPAGQEVQVLDPEPEPAVVRRPKRISIHLQEAGPLADSLTLRVPLQLPPTSRTVLPEMKGIVTLKVLAYPPRLTVENLLKAAGRTVQDEYGFKLQVLAVKRTPGGKVQVQF